MKRWLQFILVSLAASAFAHVPECRFADLGLALRAQDAAWNLNQRTNGAAIQTFNMDGKNQMPTVKGSLLTVDTKSPGR